MTFRVRHDADDALVVAVLLEQRAAELQDAGNGTRPVPGRQVDVHRRPAARALAGRLEDQQRPDPMLVERADKPTLAVLMRFADKQAVWDYFDAPDYVPLRTFRQSFSTASAIVIEA